MTVNANLEHDTLLPEFSRTVLRHVHSRARILSFQRVTAVWLVALLCTGGTGAGRAPLQQGEVHEAGTAEAPAALPTSTVADGAPAAPANDEERARRSRLEGSWAVDLEPAASPSEAKSVAHISLVEANPAPGKPAAGDSLPAPRPIVPAAPPSLPVPAPVVEPAASCTAPAKPRAQVPKEYSQFIQSTIEPQAALDLIVGRPKLLVLKVAPKRVQLESDEKAPVASYTLITDRELSLIGRRMGTATMNLWFANAADPTKEKIVSVLVRVIPDLEARQQGREWQQRYYKALEKEINQAFPDSLVCLSLVADNLVVSGQAKDIAEATQIVRIVETNAPRSFQETASIGPGQVSTTTTSTEVGLTGGTATQTTVTNPAPGEIGLAEAKTQVGQAGQARQGTVSRNVINLLKVPGEQQVMLKVTVAEVDRAATRTIGVNFSINNSSGMTVFANTTGNILSSTTGGTGTGTGIASGVGSGANLPAVIDNGKIALAINALRTLDFARTLAEPNLVTLNGQPASFQAGGEFPVPVVTGFTAAGLQGVSFVPFGVQLNFTPTITDKDRIRLNVTADVSTKDLSSSATVNGTSVPGLNTRNFRTTVELREGQTLAVAGLIQTNFGADATRVPFFGDLPVIGRFDGLRPDLGRGPGTRRAGYAGAGPPAGGQGSTAAPRLRRVRAG